MPASHQLSQLVDRLKRGTGQERQQAAEELAAMSRLGLSTSDALRALQSAAGELAPSADGKDTAAQLVRAAARMPRRVYIPVIEEHFARYSEPAKVEALRLLLHIGDQKAANTYMALVRRFARGALPSLASDALLDKPEHLERYFPELLACVEEPALAAEVCELTVALCEEGRLEPSRLRPLAPIVVRAYALRRERLLRAERAEVRDRLRQAELDKLRGEAALFLELFGHLATPEAEAELHSALGYRDPKLRAVAVGALLRLNRHVDPTHLRGVAEDPETRTWLTGRLQQIGKLALLPEARRSEATAR
ncbi:MAG: hypothetical protein ACOX6T_09570 [Myxococcales bacterium]|jgi:hypothetical protein